MEFAVLLISWREGDVSLISFVDEESGHRVDVTISLRKAIQLEVLDREGNLLASYRERISPRARVG